MLCFRKSLVAKKIMDKQGGVSRFSVGNFLSHSTEKLRRGTLLCFIKVLVSKKNLDKRGRGGREYHNFLSRFSVSQCRKFS